MKDGFDEVQSDMGKIKLKARYKYIHGMIPPRGKKCTEKTDGLIRVVFPRHPVSPVPPNSAVIGNEVEQEKNKGIKV